MKTIEQIDFSSLKDVIQLVNKCGVIERLKGRESIRTVGIKKQVVLDSFLKLMDEISDNNLDPVLPKEVIEFYNDLFSDEMTDEQKEQLVPVKEENKEENKEEKSVAKTSAKKPPAHRTKRPENQDPTEFKKPNNFPEKVRSRYGHYQTAISGQIDDLIYEGYTIQDIADALGVKAGRVSGHIKVLESKGVTIDRKVSDTTKPHTDFVKSQEEAI